MLRGWVYRGGPYGGALIVLGGVSRGTLWRCLDSARRKLAIMLAENRPLIVSHEVRPEGGDSIDSSQS
ncbi:hypothetical protein B6U99_04005 [Candidatus Geothermarchaeota archaeon ex4572_27]|nr:MAG: hypothetical protein B6U99_04005 [Candidatus Geothermarchaeota archaeon ex4572_27]